MANQTGEPEALTEFSALNRKLKAWFMKHAPDITEPKLVRDFGVLCDLMETYERLLEEALE